MKKLNKSNRKIKNTIELFYNAVCGCSCSVTRCNCGCGDPQFPFYVVNSSVYNGNFNDTNSDVNLSAKNM